VSLCIKRRMKVVDNSEYLIVVCLVLSLGGLVWGFFDGDYFFGTILAMIFFVFLLSVYKIRKFGVAYAIMEGVNDFKTENIKLAGSVADLENQNIVLGDQLDGMGRLMGIFDKGNKTAADIQKDMLTTLSCLEIENTKYLRLNKTHAFLMSDANRDGVLSKAEQEVLKLITSEDTSDADTNGDKLLSRKEYLTF
jgi:hypothetical protein